MRIEQLEQFITICEEKAFIKASDKLHIAPQTLSNSIKNLESTVNAQLFIRSNKGLELTYKGEIAYKYFKEIITTYKKFMKEIDDSIGEIAATSVTVAAIPSIELNLIPEFQCAMLLGQPNIQLNVLSGELEEVLELVENNVADIGLAAGQYNANGLIYPQIDPSWNILILREWQLYVWVGEHCSLYRKTSIHISTVEKFPILLYVPRQETLLDNTINQFFDSALTIRPYTNIKTIANLVESTSQLFFDWHCDAYGLDYQLYFTDKKAKAIPVVLDEPITLRNFAVYQDSYKQHPSYQAVIESLKATSK